VAIAEKVFEVKGQGQRPDCISIMAEACILTMWRQRSLVELVVLWAERLLWCLQRSAV